MIKKVNFFSKNVCAGIYENSTCSKCKAPLDLRFASEGSSTCSECGEINEIKNLSPENKNEK
jgi:PHP family Zn ribbon phosphoesterase